MTNRANSNSKRYEVLSEIRKDPRASYRELMERTGLHSTSAIAYHLEKLQEEGLIKKERYLSRSLYVGNGHNVKVLPTVRRKVKRDEAQYSAVRREKIKTKAEKTAERIELVVKMAEAGESVTGNDQDVILHNRSPLLYRSLHAVKVG